MTPVIARPLCGRPDRRTPPHRPAPDRPITGREVEAIFDFVLIAFALFLLIRAINRMQRHQEKAVDTRECPFCLSVIPVKASRCPSCTSEVGIASATPATGGA